MVRTFYGIFFSVFDLNNYILSFDLFMIKLLILIFISIIISVLFTPLVIRIIFRGAGLDESFRSLRGLVRWFVSGTNFDQIPDFPDLQTDSMTSVLNIGNPEKPRQRERLAYKLLRRKEIAI